MKKKMKCLLLGFAILGLLVPATTFADDWKPEIKFLRIKSGVIGGVGYAAAGYWAVEIERAIPGIKTQAVPGGIVGNLKALDKKECEIILSAPPILDWGLKGIGPYQGKKVTSSRFLVTINDGNFAVVTRKGSDIKTIKDILGKRVSFSLSKYSTHFAITSFMKMHGITKETIEKAGGKVIQADFKDEAQMLQDGMLDVATIVDTKPNGHLLNLSAKPGIEAIPLPHDEIMDKFLKAFPMYAKGTISAKMYNLSKDVPSFAQYSSFEVREDLSEELVYRITKVLWNTADFVKKNHMANLLLKEEPLGGKYTPIHPGAERFYREIGVIK